ncbi:MAG: DUF6273 domain-containing protein, partial [Clostridiales Family XIII bacterium]|nr:DUF6273 domain-containing protein [Clostridiales Family XIII bacterium]
MKMRRFSSGARRVFAGAAAMAIAVVLAAVPPLAAGSYAGESAGADVIAAAAAEPTAGDIVYFGTYPQTLIGHSEDVGVPDVPYRSVTYTDKYYEEQNGTYYYAAEPVAWRVLAKDGGRLFLLSEKQLIGGIAYNDVIGPPAAIQWSGSTMRGYLNGTMIGDLFTAEEQTAVAAARLVNDTDFDFRNGEDGAVTDDKLFLLSLRELLAYLPEMASREAPITDFADDRGQYAQPRSETPNHGAVSTAWWLREGGP